MNRALLALAGIVSLATVISAQCALGDNPNCANWVRNGFCVNGAYTKLQKQQYCPKSCPEAGCSGGGAATTAAPKENANCGRWSTEPTNAFCGRPDITLVQKKTFCFTTCAKEVATTVEDDCAFYQSVGGKVQRTGAKKETTAGTVIDTKATTTDKLLYIYAKKGCTASLYPATTTPAPGAADKEYTGAAEYFKVETAEQAKVGFGCKCA